jgi:hypothetical protein
LFTLSLATKVFFAETIFKMKKIYLLIGVLAIITVEGYSQVAFTPGNLVVYKVGDGSDTLSSAAFPVNLDELTTGGTFVSSHPLPVAISGANKRIVASGSATSEGQITRSADKRFILVTGYDTFPDPTKLKIASSLSPAVNRMIGVVGADGVIDATTALTDAYSGNNMRGAASSNGTDIWISGTGTNPGVRYLTKGSTTSTEISTTITNIRTVNIFNGQLYSASASGAFQGVCADGEGMPTSTGATIALLSGFPTSSGPSPYAFSINPAGTIMYVADDRAFATGGGIQKWTLTGSTWALDYTLNVGSSGTRGVVVNWGGSNPVIYAVTAESKSNNIVSISDTGAASSFSTLATAATNFIYRGIAFAPEISIVPVTLTSFQAALISSAVQLQWTTSQEVNAQQFVIEKSSNGVYFTNIGKTAATGNSNAFQNYLFTDANPFDGVNYYRLKTIDINGSFSYSKIVTVSYSKKEFSVYPNPVFDEATIQHPVSSNALVIISDLQGKRLKSINIAAGSTTNKYL